MTIWRMAIDKRRKHATYEEIRERHVIAGGWSTLGDLSCLYQACREGHWSWDQVRQVLSGRAENEGHDAREERFQNTFNQLLCKVEAGDIVIGYEGTTPRGICQVCDCFTYLYDVDGEVTATNPADYNRKSYEYAHCVFGVQWVDWEAFNQFVVNAGDVAIPAASGGQGPKGIDQRHDNVERILRHWNNYLGAHPDALPVPEMLVLCEQRKAALAKRDCVTELSYWRSLSMLATLEKALKLKKQVILHGPPGTGKTFLAKQFVTKHWKLPAGRWEIVQFHPAYNYEDFVRGVQVSTNKQGQVEYLAVNRVFADMCRRAANDRDNDYVLIIDEINRANLAAVLGELIYALEYRGQPVRTPYKVLGGFDLEVPKNLYIIGTMNTADRSVGHIDYAVRRRFAFLPVLPNREVIQQFFAMDNGLRALADQLYGAVEKLFTCDDNKRKLTGDFFVDDVQPGHTYFLAKSCDELLTNFVYQVLPLLHEYVKDGVLQSDATLTLGDLNIPLSQPMNPELENQIRDWFHCFAPNAQPQQPGGQAAGADPAQNPAGVDDEPEEGDE